MRKKLTIGIEVQRLFREKKHGMEVVALELIRELQKIDLYNNYIIFSRTDIDDQCIAETNNFKIRKIPASSYFTWEQLKLPAVVKEEKLDFLHSTCNTSALKLPVPLMLTLHDIIYLEKLDFKGTPYQNFGNIYRRFVVPRVVNKSEVILTVSQYEKNVIVDRLQLPEEKVKVIYNAVSDRFNMNYPLERLVEFRERYELPEKFILFLGNTAPKKNTSNVIKAYVKYALSIDSAIPIVILDYERNLVIEQLKNLQQEELINQFIFPGYVHAEEMPLIYNLASIFLYPSLRESFGLPILEAMGCGVPVITSKTSSMPEIAGGAALLIDPEQPGQIADAVGRLLKDDLLRKDLSKKGLSRSAQFTWKASAERLLSIYTSL